MGEKSCPVCAAALPADASFCPKCGKPLEAPAAPAMREERRVVTALFADVVGSTGLGGQLDPEDFRALIAGAVERMGTAIEEMGGSIETTAGDGVLGLFGAHTAREDDPERAVLAALKMIERLDDYGSEVVEELGIEPLAIRAGIESGLAVLGSRTAGSRVEDVASGDCLNTAARLQGEARPGRVLVGPLTHRLVEPLFEWAEPQALTLKGKAEPVVGREAFGVRPAGARHGSGRTRIVGRDRELALAAAAVEDVVAGQGRTVIVAGPAGIGKTRLVGELRGFLESNEPRQPSRWLEGRGLSYAGAEPYLPFRQILRQALGERDLDSTAGLRQALTRLLGAEMAAEVAPQIESIMGFALDPADALQLEALPTETLQRRVLEALGVVLGHLARRGAVAVVLDDLHWADASSVRLAAGLVGMTAQIPLLLVLTMRPEAEHPSWRLRDRALRDQPDRTSELSLEGLGPDAERSLVAELVGAGTLPVEVEREVLARTEGNPFYLEELVRSLLDTGALVCVGDAWRFDRGAPVELPDTIERVILARLDRLAPASRDVLLAASVLGRQFELALLRGILNEQTSTEAALPELERLGLVEKETPAVEYRFKHPLIQQTAYNSLLRPRRAELHSRAAAAIEEVHKPVSEEHYAVLARHHGAAGNAERAVHYHALAGRAAQRAFALDAALEHFDAALDAASELGPGPTSQDVPDLHLQRGRVHLRLGDFASSQIDLRAALEGAVEAGDRGVEMRALTDLGLTVRGSAYDEAISYQQRALSAAEEVGDRETQVAALSRLSLVESNRLRLDRALELGERALRIARGVGDDPLVTTALDCVKLAALQLGDVERLEATASEMAEIQRRTGDLFFLQWALTDAAAVPLARGDHEGALRRIADAREANRRIHDRLAAMLILEARSWIDRSAGQHGDALGAIQEASAMANDLAVPEWIAWVEASHGSHLLELFASTAALPILERALAAAEEVGTSNRLLRITSHLAWGRCLLGDGSGAREALSRAEELVGEVTAPPGGAFLFGYHSYLAIARVRLELGAPRDAEGLLRPLLEAAEAMGWLEAIAYARLLLGRARHAEGDDAEAGPLLRSALEAATQAGTPGPGWEAHAALAEAAAAKGDAAEAQRQRAEARAIVERLAATIRDDRLRAGFLKSTALARAGQQGRAP